MQAAIDITTTAQGVAGVAEDAPERARDADLVRAGEAPRDAGEAPRDAADLDLELTTRLRETGHRVTSQRIFVHRALCAQGRHLTAEQVLDAVSEALPSISLPTIYATLELLEDLGIVRRVSAGGALLFESRTDPHAHAVCRRCGAVVDIDQPGADAYAPALELTLATGFQPEDAQLLIWGLCPSCSAASRAAAAAAA